MSGIVQDITGRKQTEEALAASQQQFLQSQKMEAVGRLAGGIAHDFNNLLTVITGYSDLMLTGLGEFDPLREEVNEIKQATDRATALTRQLLAFSRNQVLQPKVLNLNEVVADVNRLLGRLIGEDIQVVNITEPKLGLIKADPGQLEQVIINLAVNARDAMPVGGKLVLKTANVWLDDTHTQNYPGVQPGPYIKLEVSDTGSGMDRATQARIFEPFFTTKEVGKGTGLGLSTVYGIVNQSGGHIDLYSEVGKGSIFKVYFPRMAASVGSERRLVSSSLKALPGGTETILLVEDEKAVRSLAIRLLSMVGYKVLAAQNGTEALLSEEIRQGQIDLLITDMVMPEMSGRELAERLVLLQPGLRVVYMSGYTNEFVANEGVVAEGVAFLQKPFKASDLASKVREVLDRPAK